MKRLNLLVVSVGLLLLALPASALAQRYERDRVGRESLKESVKRVDKMSGELKGELDRALDRSRLDGRKREDRINDLAGEFHSAASKFKDKYDNGHYRRAEGEARATLELGWRMDEIIQRNALGGNLDATWVQIRSDLEVIQDAYGGDRPNRDDRPNQ
jgi:hypothetical protein